MRKAALKFVAHEAALLTDGEFAVGDDGVCPGFFFLVGGHEGTFECDAVGSMNQRLLLRVLLLVQFPPGGPSNT